MAPVLRPLLPTWANWMEFQPLEFQALVHQEVLVEAQLLRVPGE